MGYFTILNVHDYVISDIHQCGLGIIQGGIRLITGDTSIIQSLISHLITQQNLF